MREKRKSLNELAAMCGMNIGLLINKSVEASFLMYFFNTVLGMGTEQASVINVFSSTIAIPASLFGGMMVSKYTLNTKKQYSMWLLVLSAALSVLRILCFVNYGLKNHNLLLLLYCLVFFLENFCEDSCSTALLAVISLMGVTEQRRSQLISARTLGTQLSSVIVSASLLPLMHFISPDNASFGFLFVQIIYSVITLSGGIWLYFAAKGYEEESCECVDGGEKQISHKNLVSKNRKAKNELYYDEEISTEQSVSFKVLLLELKNNKALTFFVLTEMFRCSIHFFASMIIVYYCTYVFGDVATATLTMSISTGIGIAAPLFYPYLSKKCPPSVFYRLVIAGQFVVYLLVFFCGKEQYIFMVLYSAGVTFHHLGTCSALSLTGDISDQRERVSGHYVRGIVMTLYSVSFKLGKSLASLVLAAGFSLVGFSGHGTEAAGQIHVVMTMGAMILASLAGATVHFSRLEEKK